MTMEQQQAIMAYQQAGALLAEGAELNEQRALLLTMCRSDLRNLLARYHAALLELHKACAPADE